MRRVEIDTQNVGFPMPVALLGTRHEGRVNFMALAWLTRVNSRPPQVAVAVGRSHASASAVTSNRCFGLSVPSKDQLVATDYVGLVSGRTIDKSSAFPVFVGEQQGAPMAATCPVAMECRVVESLELPASTLFVGEIVKAYADERCLREGRVDLAKVDPLLLSMPDNHYWRMSAAPIGSAWSAGRALQAPAARTRDVHSVLSTGQERRS